MAGVRERTLPIERPLLVSEVSANVCRYGCHVVSMTDPQVRNIDFLDQSCLLFFEVVNQLYSPNSADHIPDSLLLGKSGSAGN
jgi:hypothetical protein